MHTTRKHVNIHLTENKGPQIPKSGGLLCSWNECCVSYIKQSNFYHTRFFPLCQYIQPSNTYQVETILHMLLHDWYEAEPTLVSIFHRLLESTHKHYDPEIRCISENSVNFWMDIIPWIQVIYLIKDQYHYYYHCPKFWKHYCLIDYNYIYSQTKFLFQSNSDLEKESTMKMQSLLYGYHIHLTKSPAAEQACFVTCLKLPTVSTM